MTIADGFHAAHVAKLVARDFYTDQLDLRSRGIEAGLHVVPHARSGGG